MVNNYDIVTFEIAEKLNKLGYLQRIGYYYNIYNKMAFTTSYHIHAEAVFAPDVKEASEWLKIMFNATVEPSNDSIAEFLETIKS